jgi:hypothetical protein
MESYYEPMQYCRMPDNIQRGRMEEYLVIALKVQCVTQELIVNTNRRLE